MTRCAFLRGRSILTCFVLYIASASGKRDPTVGKMQAAAAAVGKESGPTIPIFQQLSVQSKAQPISSLPGFDDIESLLRSNNGRHGGRRAQDACATEKETLYTCLPDLSCEGCYNGLLQDIENLLEKETNTWCGEIESRLCGVSTNCACGCDFQAEVYYQCRLVEAGCENTADCADTTCEEELIKLADCQSVVGNSCAECAGDDVNLLLDTASTVSCVDIESTFCASLDTCDCGECAEEAERFYACSYEEFCPFFSCDASTPAPTPVPTPSPMLGVVCYVCGDPDLSVDPTKSVEIENEDRQCSEVQDEYETSQQVSQFECNTLIEAVTESCNCGAPPTIPSPPTSSPVTGTATESKEDGFNYAALSALVAIPLLGVIVYLVKRKQTGDVPGTKPVPISAGAPEKDFSETPPTTPSPDRHHSRRPDYYHHPTDGSATASMRTDEDHIYGLPPIVVATPTAQSSGGGWAASGSVRSHEDHLHDSVGEVSAGSGRSSAPLGASGNMASRHYPSSPGVSLRSSGEGTYLPHNKDQCRSIAEEVPMAAVVVDQFDAPRQEPYERKRPADPSGVRDDWF